MAQAIVTLKNVRVNYVRLAEPWKFPGDPEGSEKYTMEILIPDDHPQLDELKKIIDDVAEEAFPKMTAAQKRTLRNPLRVGEEKEDKAYHNGYFMRLKSIVKPRILNPQKKLATDKDFSDYCYSGARMHVSFTLRDYDQASNRGVTAYLRQVMFYRQDESLYTPVDDFKEVEIEEESNDSGDVPF